jgi:hypothetical protein
MSLYISIQCIDIYISLFSQYTIAIQRYRELQNYLQIYTCTITEKQKWTVNSPEHTHLHL